MIPFLNMPGMGEVMAAMEAGRPPSGHWPASAVEAAVAFGYGTWASAWLCDEASGNLADSIGAVTLSPAATPAYRQPGAFAGDYAVAADSSTDDFTAASSATYDITTSGQIAFYACMKFPAAQADYLIGKHGGTGGYYAVRLDASGFLHLETFDGTTTRTSSVNANHVTGGFVDILAMVDRDGGIQKLATNLGVSSDTSIAAAASMTGTGVVRFSLAITANFPSVAYAAVANAGVADLRGNAATAITNIRRFTGRG